MKKNGKQGELIDLHLQNRNVEFEVNSDIESENEPGLISDFNLTPLMMLNNIDQKESNSENSKIADNDFTKSKNEESEASEEHKTVEHIKIRLAPKSPKKQPLEETPEHKQIPTLENCKNLKNFIHIKKSNCFSKRSNSQTNNDTNSCYKVFTQRFKMNIVKDDIHINNLNNLNNIKIINNELEDLPLKGKLNFTESKLKLKHATSQKNLDVLSRRKDTLFSNKKSNYEMKMREDIEQFSEMKSIPQINRKSKQIVQNSQKIQEMNKVCNIYEKLSSSKNINKERNQQKEASQREIFPFKPTINPVVKIKSKNKFNEKSKNKVQDKKIIRDASKQMLDKEIKNHKKIYKDLKEQRKKEDYLAAKKAELSMSLQIRNLNKEIDLELKRMDITENFICKDNLKTLLQSLSFLHINNYKGENELLEEFWYISSNSQNKAKIENIKILLNAISKILKLDIIEKKMNLSYDTLFKINLNDSKIYPLPPSTTRTDRTDLKDHIDHITYHKSEDPLATMNIIYDKDENILLSMKIVNELSKQFITLYCNRFSRKIKNESKGYKNRKLIKDEINFEKLIEDKTSFPSQQKNNIFIPDLIQRLFYSCSSRTKSPERYSDSSQLKLKFSKNELITRIATSTERKSVNNQETENIQFFNKKNSLVNEKLFERLNYCKKRSINKTEEIIDFEKSKDFLTFTPKISFYKSNKSSIIKLSNSQELDIQRLRRGHSERRGSANILDLFSKKGQTSIRNDISYKKFQNDLKALNDSDNVLTRKVEKFLKNKELSVNFNLNINQKEKKIDSNPFYIKNCFSMQKCFSPERISLNLNSCKSKNPSDSQSQLKKEAPVLSTSLSLMPSKEKVPIAIIKINNYNGIKTINVTKQETLPEIAAKIATENSSLNRSK